MHTVHTMLLLFFTKEEKRKPPWGVTMAHQVKALASKPDSSRESWASNPRELIFTSCSLSSISTPW